MYVLVIVCYCSMKWWLRININIICCSYCKLEGYTKNFLSNDSVTLFPIFTIISTKWLDEITRKRWKIFLTRPNFIVNKCKSYPMQITSVRSILVTWKAWAEDIVSMTFVLKIASSGVVAAACLKYWLLGFPIFGLHKAMVPNSFSDRVTYVSYVTCVRFRIKSTKKGS